MSPRCQIIDLSLTFRSGKIIMLQLTTYLMDNSLFPTFQCAYRSRHSIATALLCVISDTVDAKDNGHVAVLLLLDFIGSFDTVNNSILLQRYNLSV